MLHHLINDTPIADYTKRDRVPVATSSQREKIIKLVIELHKQKEYKFATLSLAVSIVDRYLLLLSKLPRKASPVNGVALSCVSLLVAAKLEQTISPSYLRMISLLDLEQQKGLKKSDLLRLERDVIRALQFDF